MLRKEIVYIFSILLLVVIMLLKPVRNEVYARVSDFFYPFFSLVLKVEGIVDQKILTLKDKRDLVARFSELRRNNSELSAKCDQLGVVLGENNELRRLLGLKINPRYDYVFAEIMYRDPVQWFNHFTINKGENDGVKSGAVVLARIDDATSNGPVSSSLRGGGQSKGEQASTVIEKGIKGPQFGVVGRISSVSKHTAYVSTIVSDECNLSVLIPENDATGVLTGGRRIGREFRSQISYLPRDLVYKSSSSVLTSGMNALIPANLKVGNVRGGNSSTVSVYNNLFVQAELKPAIDLNHLKFVLILVKK